MDPERLRRLPLFGDLDHHDLSTLARLVSEIEVAEGDLLVEEGSLPYRFFVIEEGTAEVLREGVPIATLGPGDVVGEMGLLRGERRAASVRATATLRAIGMDADGFAAMSEEMPELARLLRETMAQRDRR
jgi:CRP-like cAMP-binding protein